MATQTMSKDDILEAIGNMSVFELAELIEAFKGKFGVTIAAPAAHPRVLVLPERRPRPRRSRRRRSSPSSSSRAGRRRFR